MKMDDLVDIAESLPARAKPKKPLYLKKQWIHDGRQTFEIVVNRDALARRNRSA